MKTLFHRDRDSTHHVTTASSQCLSQQQLHHFQSIMSVSEDFPASTYTASILTMQQTIKLHHQHRKSPSRLSTPNPQQQVCLKPPPLHPSTVPSLTQPTAAALPEQFPPSSKPRSNPTLVVYSNRTAAAGLPAKPPIHQSQPAVYPRPDTFSTMVNWLVGPDRLPVDEEVYHQIQLAFCVSANTSPEQVEASLRDKGHLSPGLKVVKAVIKDMGWWNPAKGGRLRTHLVMTS